MLLQLLREFSYEGDFIKMREAIVKVLVECKNPSELCKTVGIPVSELDLYVRLLKVLVWTENEVKLFSRTFM